MSEATALPTAPKPGPPKIIFFGGGTIRPIYNPENKKFGKLVLWLVYSSASLQFGHISGLGHFYT